MVSLTHSDSIGVIRVPEKYAWMRDTAEITEAADVVDLKDEDAYLGEVESETKLINRYTQLAITADAMRAALGDKRVDALIVQLKDWTRPHWNRVHELTDARVRALAGSSQNGTVRPAAPAERPAAPAERTAVAGKAG
jgi:hypothetical protein